MHGMFVKSRGGFTIIEAMIAVVILAVGIVGVITMVGVFSKDTVDRTLYNSLLDAASSGLTLCGAVSSTTSPLTYTYENNLVVTVTLSGGSCSPSANACNTITATANAKGKNVVLTTLVCNYS